MKTIFRLLTIFAAVLTMSQGSRAASNEAPPPGRDIDAASRFVFYSVLEGLYEDGLSDEDVKQILMRKEKQTYFHFILSCPLCGATIWALEAYRGRPKSFYGLKREGSTFGHGLSDAQRKLLYSDDPPQRLVAINTLVKTWIERRMNSVRLTDAERKDLLDALEKKRKAGMDALESFRKKQHGENLGVAEAAPAYVHLDECAVCNGAVGKPMKLPEEKPR